MGTKQLAGLIGRIRTAAADPGAPWYGSDLVPWVADLCEVAEKQAAEIERLQAIVEKLPKTADGVPVVPGMRLWAEVRDNNETWSGWMHAEGIEHITGGRWLLCGGRREPDAYVDECYSTREAAEAARE